MWLCKTTKKRAKGHEWRFFSYTTETLPSTKK
jgi:hypothetical protein